jgi:hypothetical protein
MERDERVILVVIQICFSGCTLDCCYSSDPYSDDYVSINLPKVPDLAKIKEAFPNAEIKIRDWRSR